MKIKNIAPGPRGIHTIDGSRVLQPGETIDADLSEAELKGSKETGWFEISGKAKEDDELDRDELKAQAKELGIEHAGNISNVKLKELIDAKLAE